MTSEWKCVRPYFHEVNGSNGETLTVLYGILIALIFFVNIILIIMLVKTKGKLFTNTSKLFIFLACINLLTACVLLPYKIYMIKISSKATCTDVGFLSFFGTLIPTLLSETTALVVTDRYYLITHKLMHRTYFSSHRFIVYLILMVSASSCWGVAHYYISQQTDSRKIAYFFISFIIYILILIVICIVFNVKILQTVVKALRNSTLSRSNKRTERRLSRTVTVISTILVICYIPFIIGLTNASSILHRTTNIAEISSALMTVQWTLLFVYLNSVLNSCAYLLRSHNIRRFILPCLHKRNISEKSSLNTSIRPKKVSLPTLVSITMMANKRRDKSLSQASKTLEIKRGVLVRKQKTSMKERKRESISGKDNLAIELQQ